MNTVVVYIWPLAEYLVLTPGKPVQKEVCLVHTHTHTQPGGSGAGGSGVEGNGPDIQTLVSWYQGITTYIPDRAKH